MKNIIFLVAIILFTPNIVFSKSGRGGLKSEEAYLRGLPIPEEYVTPGITLDKLLEFEKKVWTTEEDNLRNNMKPGDVFYVLDQLRRTKDYTQIDKLREFAEISKKKSRRYQEPDTYWQWKSLDWPYRNYEAALVVIRDLEKIKAEDEAAGRIENNTPDASGSEPHQDSISGQNQASGEEPSNEISLPWWLAGILFLILAAIWHILRTRKKTAH